MNIVEKIKNNFIKRNDSIAVTRGAQNSITYSALFKQVELYSKKLQQNQVLPYDRVALFCEDSIEYIILALSILNNGAVVVPLSPSLSYNELESLCEQLKVKFILSEKKLDNYSLKPDCLFEKLYFYAIDKNIQYSLNYKNINSPAFIRFSSGTTGKSKGVLLTHHDIFHRVNAANHGLNISERDTIGWFLSMSFHFVVSILLFLLEGAHIILAHDNFPAGIIDSFDKNRPTFLYASPFHYNMMANHQSISKNLLSKTRMAVVTAVSLNKKTDNDFYQKFNIHLSQAYGIIEVGLPFINNKYDNDFICSVGQLLPSYDLKIKNPDESGKGNILLKGKGMYSAYIRPFKEQLSDEWFDTGDIGYLKDSYLFITGRSKNMINFAGMKIFPEEVEKVILSFDNIKEVKVSGEPHEIYGQLPVAEIVLLKGNKINNIKLKKHCLKRLDSYKVPKEFIIVASIEKTLSNKIKRV